jgi:hypothetical protein
MATEKPESSSRGISYSWRNGLVGVSHKIGIAITSIWIAFVALVGKHDAISVLMTAIFFLVYAQAEWKMQARRAVPLSKNMRILRIILLAALFFGIGTAALLIKQFFHLSF